MTSLNPGRLGDALRADACDIHPLEADTKLVIGAPKQLHQQVHHHRHRHRRWGYLFASSDREAAVTGLDQHNVRHLIDAIRHASGQRQEPGNRLIQRRAANHPLRQLLAGGSQGPVS